jgi:hypothetical protein
LLLINESSSPRAIEGIIPTYNILKENANSPVKAFKFTKETTFSASPTKLKNN